MEQISALMDGEAGEQEAHQALLRLGDTAEVREAWDTYHLIGEVMRGELAQRINVRGRVAEALAQEPTVLAPAKLRKTRTPMTFALSAAASVSAVAVVGWMAFSTGNVVNPPAEIAKAPQAVVPVTAEPRIESAPSDGQMNEYLLAHQGVSPSTSLHGVAPYIRTISVASATDR